MLPKRTYSDEFIARVKDFAVLQLTPSQIAERMGLKGIERVGFLTDINMKLHPLAAAYHVALESGLADVQDSLHSLAVSGDTDAIELMLRLNKENESEELKRELFGV